MTLRTSLCALFAALTIGFLAGTAFTEDPADPNQAAHDAMMEQMLALAKPGAEHAMLARMEGEWDVAVRAWPGGKLEESSATTSARMVLGGRYLQSSYAGTMFDMKYAGVGMMGYDNGRKHFHAQWYDTMGTGMYPMTGEASEDGSRIVLRGTWVSPDGSMKMPTRMVYTFHGDDSFVMEHFATMGEQEHREMELTYTRRKSAAKPARCCPPSGKGPGY